MGGHSRSDNRKTKAQLLAELADLRVRLARAERSRPAGTGSAAQEMLLAAIQKMPDGLAYYDAEDRLVVCNDRYREIYAGVSDLFVPGARFEELVAAAVRRGLHVMGEDPDRFYGRRLRAHRAGDLFEHEIDGGRIIHARDHALEGGGWICIRIDVTEQRRAEAAVRESEAFARAVVGASDDGVVVVDERGRIMLMNRSAERIFACESAEALGGSLEALFVPEAHREDHRRVIEHLREVEPSVAVGHRVSFEAQRYNGERFPAELSVGMATRGDERFFIWFVRDITKRRRVQAALERSEVNLRALMDNTQIALHLKRLDGRYILANRRYLDWAGCTADELAGRTNEELHAARSLMDANVMAAIRDQDAEMLRTKSAVTREYELLMADGRSQFWEVTKFPIQDETGSIAAIGSSGVEITARRHAEAELRRQKMLMQVVLDHTPVALTLVDPANRYVLVNREFCRRYGFAEADVIGRRPRDVFVDGQHYSPEAYEKMEWLRRTMVETARPSSDEWTVRFVDGSPRIVSFTRFPIFDEEGRLVLAGSTAIDVTEARRAQADLERSEANLRALMDHTQVALILKDLDGRFLVANRRFLDWCGVSAEQVVGRTNGEIHGINATASERNILDLDEQEEVVRRTGEAVTREHEMRPAGGDPQYWIVTKFPVRDAAGEVVAIGSTGIEITETRRAEAALRHQDRLTRVILDHTPVALTLWDETGRFALANREFYRRYGLSEEGVIGRTSTEIFGDGRLIGREALATMQGLRRESLETGEPRTAEYTVRYADGSRHTVLATRFPIRDENGRILYSGSTVTDITGMRLAEAALRQNEAMLRAVLDNLPSMVTLKQPDGRYLMANRAAEEGFGPIVGKLTGEVVDRDLADVAADQEHRVIESGRAETEEHVYPGGKGAEIHRSVTKFPVRDPDGGLIGIGSISTDVTELKETQARLAQAQKMEAVGQLTGGIAHDFNNLLQVVIGNLSLLAERPLDREAVELLEAAGRAARRGAEVTHQLLAFGRRQTLRPRVVDVGELIGELAGLFRRALGGRTDVALELEYAAWPVRVDPGQLQSALLNLCINGRDAMPDGGVIGVATRNIELTADGLPTATALTPGRYVVLSVTDHGVGMSPDVLEHALDPFFTTKEVGQGSGLGLSMVYGFIRQSGGDLRLLSEVGRGTTVELYLPAAELLGKQEVAAPDGEGAGLKVLLVEHGGRSSTGGMLEDLGCRVIRSGDLDTAIRAAERHHPVDLLLVETGAGGPSSAEALARAVLARSPGVPVVYVSGRRGRTEDEGASPAHPAAVMLLRPFGRDALRDKIVEALMS